MGDVPGFLVSDDGGDAATRDDAVHGDGAGYGDLTD